MRGRTNTIPVILFLLSTVGSVAEAQAPPLGHVEILGGVTFVFPRADTTLTTSYAPELRFGTVTASSAGQTLRIAGEDGPGVELGAAFFFAEAVGLQVLLGADRFDVSGTNGPYSTHLEYVSRQPPDYTPRAVVIDHEQGWPDTVGELKARHLSGNLVGRWRLGRRAVGQASGGVTYFRMEGLVSPVGYTVYHLGGHSVLFPEEYQLELTLGPAHAWGVNAGGTLDIDLARQIAITVDFRYFAGGTLAAPVQVERVVNPDEIGILDDIETIQEGLQPPPVELSTRRVRAMAGLKIRF